MRENSTRGFAPWTHCVARLAQPYRLPTTVQYPAGRPKGSPHKRQVQEDETTFSRRGEGEFTRVGIWRRCLGSDFVPCSPPRATQASPPRSTPLPPLRV